MNDETKKIFDQYVSTWHHVIVCAMQWDEYEVKKLISLWLQFAFDESAPFFHRPPTYYVSGYIRRYFYPNITGFEIIAIARDIEKILDEEIGAKSKTYPTIPSKADLCNVNWAHVRTRIEALVQLINKNHASDKSWF